MKEIVIYQHCPTTGLSNYSLTLGVVDEETAFQLAKQIYLSGEFVEEVEVLENNFPIYHASHPGYVDLEKPKARIPLSSIAAAPNMLEAIQYSITALADTGGMVDTGELIENVDKARKRLMKVVKPLI